MLVLYIMFFLICNTIDSILDFLTAILQLVEAAIHI